MKPEIQKKIEKLKQIGENPKNSIIETKKQSGKQLVGCFPIYVPEELVYAAGALPIGMWGGSKTGSKADSYLQSFCCSIMRANTEQSLAGDYNMLSAVIMTAYCDTLKCMIENWKAAVSHLNIIPVVYPQNRKTDSGKKFFKEELNRVKGELEKILKVEITDEAIEEALEVYEEYRKTMREFTSRISDFPETFDAATRHQVIKAAYFMDKKDYMQEIKEILKGLEKEKKEDKTRKKKIILTGLMAEPTVMLDLFTENDMYVVSDDLAQESRQFRTEAPKEGTWSERIAKRLAMQDGCTFLYDCEKSRGQKLIQTVKNCGADAVIFCQMKFCDPDEFDYPIVKKELEAAQIPMLYIEFEQQMESVGQLRTRIQSFAEMLD